ncbi:unnamed protein product, partial [Didymodactylos carnosus]
MQSIILLVLIPFIVGGPIPLLFGNNNDGHSPALINSNQKNDDPVCLFQCVVDLTMCFCGSESTPLDYCCSNKCTQCPDEFIPMHFNFTGMFDNLNLNFIGMYDNLNLNFFPILPDFSSL